MKKKLLALVLSLVLLCGVAAGFASAELWKNWPLWGTFGLGHNAEGKTAQWICFKTEDGYLKFISIPGFDSEDDAEEFLDNCFNEKEKEYLVAVNDNGDMHEFREDLDEGLFNDKLVHPIVYVKSGEVNKYRIINVDNAHRFGVIKDKLKSESQKLIKISMDPWIGWARKGDIVTIKATYPEDVTGPLMLVLAKDYNPGGAKRVDFKNDTNYAEIKVQVGSDDFAVTIEPSLK